MSRKIVIRNVSRSLARILKAGTAEDLPCPGSKIRSGGEGQGLGRGKGKGPLGVPLGKKKLAKAKKKKKRIVIAKSGQGYPRWRTIHGAKVQLGKGGKVLKGPAKLSGKNVGTAAASKAKEGAKKRTGPGKGKFDKPRVKWSRERAGDAMPGKRKSALGRPKVKVPPKPGSSAASKVKPFGADAGRAEQLAARAERGSALHRPRTIAAPKPGSSAASKVKPSGRKTGESAAERQARNDSYGPSSWREQATEFRAKAEKAKSKTMKEHWLGMAEHMDKKVKGGPVKPGTEKMAPESYLRSIRKVNKRDETRRLKTKRVADEISRRLSRKEETAGSSVKGSKSKMASRLSARLTQTIKKYNETTPGGLRKITAGEAASAGEMHTAKAKKARVQAGKSPKGSAKRKAGLAKAKSHDSKANIFQDMTRPGESRPKTTDKAPAEKPAAKYEPVKTHKGKNLSEAQELHNEAAEWLNKAKGDVGEALIDHDMSLAPELGEDVPDDEEARWGERVQRAISKIAREEKKAGGTKRKSALSRPRVKKPKM